METEMKKYTIIGKFTFATGRIYYITSTVEGFSIYDALQKSWCEAAIHQHNEWPIKIEMTVKD